MEDLRGGRQKETPKFEPDKAGENEEKKANPDEKKRNESDPKGGGIGKNRSTDSDSVKYNSERKPI